MISNIQGKLNNAICTTGSACSGIHFNLEGLTKIFPYIIFTCYTCMDVTEFDRHPVY